MTARALSTTEIDHILENLVCKRDRCLFLLGIHTGFRISELLSLSISDLIGYNQVNFRITVKRRNMKGKLASRSVILHPKAKEALKEYLDEKSRESSELLFRISRFQAHRILSKATKGAQITGKISTHSCRKTFGMKVYEATGKNIVAAQRALGHKSLASTTHYLSVDQEEIDRAILEGV